MSEFSDKYKPWIGIAFLLSISLLAANILSSTFIWVNKKILWQRNLKRYKKYLHSLTSEEKLLLRGYILQGTRTQKLRGDSGVVQGLVSNKVIYRSSSMGDPIDGFAHNIQPWAWEYLNKCPDLLFSEEEIMELLNHENL